MTTSASPSDPARIQDAADKNRAATAQVQKVADELAIVHTVLDSTLAASNGDLKQAVARTGQAEAKLEKAVEKLDEVSDILDKEAQSRKP